MSVITASAGPPRSRLSEELYKGMSDCSVHDGTGIDLGGHYPATLAKDPRLPEPSGELESIASTKTFAGVTLRA